MDYTGGIVGGGLGGRPMGSGDRNLMRGASNDPYLNFLQMLSPGHGGAAGSTGTSSLAVAKTPQSSANLPQWLQQMQASMPDSQWTKALVAIFSDPKLLQYFQQFGGPL